jgi:hypothetical protein
MNHATNNRINTDQSLLSGTKKALGKSDHVVIDGKKYFVADIIAVLQDRIDVATAVVTARAALHRAVRADRAKVAETKRFVSAVRQTLLIMYGSHADVLAAFGLKVTERRALKVAEKVERIARAEATRKARHTMGKRQKEGIKGVVVSATPPSPPDSPPPALAASVLNGSGSAAKGA